MVRGGPVVLLTLALATTPSVPQHFAHLSVHHQRFPNYPRPLLAGEGGLREQAG
jgi:hypothetical protein